MKKLCVLLAGLLLLSLAGCSWNNIRIEDHTWVLLCADKTNDGTFLACSSKYAESFGDGLKAENLVIVDVVCAAADGKLTFTDKTGDKAYEATYELTDENRWPFHNDRATIYGVTMDGDLGMASTCSEPHTESEKYMLTVMVGDYSALFVAQEHLDVS